VGNRLLVKALLQPLEQSIELLGLDDRPWHNRKVVPMETSDEVRSLLHFNNLLKLQLEPELALAINYIVSVHVLLLDVLLVGLDNILC
jgi:hypothetical protein